MKMGMKPSHPGRILKNMYLDPLRLTVTETAQGLGVSRKQLSALLNQRAGVSPEMAVRLSEAFSTTAEFWTGLQMQFDTWNAEQNVSRKDIVHFYPKLSA